PESLDEELDDGAAWPLKRAGRAGGPAIGLICTDGRIESDWSRAPYYIVCPEGALQKIESPSLAAFDLSLSGVLTTAPSRPPPRPKVTSSRSGLISHSRREPS